MIGSWITEKFSLEQLPYTLFGFNTLSALLLGLLLLFFLLYNLSEVTKQCFIIKLLSMIGRKKISLIFIGYFNYQAKLFDRYSLVISFDVIGYLTAFLLTYKALLLVTLQ
jgi:hypothetical protein